MSRRHDRGHHHHGGERSAHHQAAAQHQAQDSSVILVTGSFDNTIRFWAASTGLCYRSLNFADSQVNCLCISPDKQWLAAGGHSHLRLYEINSNRSSPRITYTGHAGNITSVGFQKNGKWMYSSGEDGTVKIWDLRASNCQRSHNNTRSGRVNFTNSGSQNQGSKQHQRYNSSNNTARKNTNANGTTTKNTKRGNYGGGQGNNGRSSGTGGKVHMPAINTCCLHPNQGEIIYGDHDGNVRWWDLIANRRSQEVIPEREAAIRSLSIASDASLICAATMSGHVHLWKPDKLISKRGYNHFNNNSYAANGNANSVLGSAASDQHHQTVFGENIDHENVTTQTEQSGGETSLPVTPASSVSGSPVSSANNSRRSSRRQSWNVDDVNDHLHNTNNPIVSPDVKLLATASADHSAKLWHINEVYDHESRTEDGMAPSQPSNSNIGNGNGLNQQQSSSGQQQNSSYHMTNLPTTSQLHLKLYKTLANHQRWIWDCVFSADSSYLVTTSSDQSARLWDLQQGDVVRHYTGHQKAVVCVALNDSA
eukprot:g2779.t1